MKNHTNRSKFKGYLLLWRKYNKLIFDTKISLDVLGLFSVYIMSADWDRRHKMFGAIKLSDNYLGKIVAKCNRNKISKLQQELIKNNLIKIIKYADNTKIIQIINFDDMQPIIDYQMNKILNNIGTENTKHF